MSVEESDGRRGRGLVVWVLIVVAFLVTFVWAFTVWVHRQALDNDGWHQTNARLIHDPTVRTAVSELVVDQLYSNVDVQQALGSALPGQLGQLAGPISAALRRPATEAVEQLLDRPRIQRLWLNATDAAHRQAVNVLKNQTGAGITTGNGNVTVDLSQLARTVGGSIGIPASALDRLPPDAGKVVVLRSDQLGTAQRAVKAVNALSVLLILVALALYALALFLAKGARRETLRDIGWSFVLGGLLILVVRRLGASTSSARSRPPATRPSPTRSGRSARACCATSASRGSSTAS